MSSRQNVDRADQIGVVRKVAGCAGSGDGKRRDVLACGKLCRKPTRILATSRPGLAGGRVAVFDGRRNTIAGVLSPFFAQVLDGNTVVGHLLFDLGDHTSEFDLAGGFSLRGELGNLGLEFGVSRHDFFVKKILMAKLYLY